MDSQSFVREPRPNRSSNKTSRWTPFIVICKTITFYNIFAQKRPNLKGLFPVPDPLVSMKALSQNKIYCWKNVIFSLSNTIKPKSLTGVTKFVHFFGEGNGIQICKRCAHDKVPKCKSDTCEHIRSSGITKYYSRNLIWTKILRYCRYTQVTKLLFQ